MQGSTPSTIGKKRAGLSRFQSFGGKAMRTRAGRGGVNMILPDLRICCAGRKADKACWPFRRARGATSEAGSGRSAGFPWPIPGFRFPETGSSSWAGVMRNQEECRTAENRCGSPLTSISAGLLKKAPARLGRDNSPGMFPGRGSARWLFFAVSETKPRGAFL